MRLGSIEFTESGVEMPRSATFEDFEQAIMAVAIFRRASPMWLGRLALEGQRRFGDKFWSMLTTCDASLEDLHRLAGVCDKVSQLNWNARLSMTHHQFAATLPPHIQKAALQQAADEGLNSGEFRNLCAAIRKGFGGRS